jgi:hypothetical protein
MMRPAEPERNWQKVALVAGFFDERSKWENDRSLADRVARAALNRDYPDLADRERQGGPTRTRDQAVMRNRLLRQLRLPG